MHNFLIFYAPLIVVVVSMVLSFIIADKGTRYEE